MASRKAERKAQKKAANSADSATRSTRSTRSTKDLSRYRRQMINKSLKEAKKKGDREKVAKLAKLLQNDDDMLNSMTQADWDDVMVVDGEEYQADVNSLQKEDGPGVENTEEDGPGVKNTEEDGPGVKNTEEDTIRGVEENKDKDDKTNGNPNSKEPGEGSNSTKKNLKDDETKEGSGSRKKKKVIIQDSIESDDEDSLFIRDIDKEDEDERAIYRDEEYGKPLHTNPGITNAKNIKTVGWYGDRSTKFINMHGKKSHARYRIESTAYPIDYERSPPRNENVSNKNNRLGDVIDDDGKLMYTRRYILHIWAVAWATGRAASDYDLNSIDPDRVKNWRSVRTYVLIEWDVQDRYNKNIRTWEPRSALRDRYGKENADKIIFDAACEAEDRFSMANSGSRTAYSRSPSAALAQDRVREYRQQSIDASSRRSTRSLTPSKTARSSRRARSPTPDDDEDDISDTPSRHLRSSKRSRSPTPDAHDHKSILKDFIENYFQLYEIEHNSPKDLHGLERAEFVNAWGAHKASLIQV